jgi:hypothetical protein
MVLHAFPRFALEGTTLKVDFGAIMLLPKSDRFVADSTMFDNSGEPLTLVGLPTSDGRLPAALGGYALETISLLQQQIRLKDESLRRAEREAADARSRVSDLEIEQREFEHMLDRERNLHGTQIGGLESRIARLQSELDTFRRQADEKVKIDAFATSLGTGIGRAQTELQRMGFQIGRVAVTARAFVDEKGESLQFPNRADSADVAAAPVTDISIAFQPTTAPEAADGKVAVPDVNQLTESAARRVLASIGLQLEATYGPPNLRPGSVEGQAMLQTPAAGVYVERGVIVLVVFARGAA